MIKRSEILHAAWAKYRETAALIGLAKFSRKHFAMNLRMAWAEAKTLAFYVALEAEEAAEAVAHPARADARAELVDLNMKDRWIPADFSRVSALNQAIAA
ncbi:hypothetical protein [Devosia sp.]|uniref:hypothetical protein n=1 Tax=Devosia sp. TaxID=1871048 RepID=UPI00292E8D62|nr:hypothetical protein [Devosia sp.]